MPKKGEGRPLTPDEKEARARARLANAPQRAEDRARRRAEALRSGFGVLRIADVCAVFNIHPTTLWRWKQAGEFPAPDLRRDGLAGWYAKTITDLLEKRLKAA